MTNQANSRGKLRHGRISKKWSFALCQQADDLQNWVHFENSTMSQFSRDCADMDLHAAWGGACFARPFICQMHFAENVGQSRKKAQNCAFSTFCLTNLKPD
jgi:hypothetical protein